jgi:L-iditol 2-dehydrogenase
MLAVEYHTNEDVRVVEVPKPEIGPGELLVQMRACGLCASDVMEWYMSPRAPLYPGHEAVGVIAAVGDGMPEEQFNVGQRIFFHHHVPCMVCHFCQRGSYSQCTTFRETRLYPGGLAEYICVPAQNVQLDVLPLPDDLSFEAATLIEPLACCLRGINRASIQPGDSVLILGAGSNGLLLGQLAQQRGAARVIIVDPIPYRLQRARDIGIDYALNPQIPGQNESLLEQVFAVNGGRKADIVLVTPSSTSAMELGLALVGPGGTVLLFAPPPPEATLPIKPNYLFFQEISLRTSYSAGPYETRLALELLRSGRIRPETVITHRFSLRDAAQAFRLVANPGNALKAVIVSDELEQDAS